MKITVEIPDNVLETYKKAAEFNFKSLTNTELKKLIKTDITENLLPQRKEEYNANGNDDLSIFVSEYLEFN